MIPTSPAPALKVKTLEQQNADFTAEGSPPPGTVATSIQLKSTPTSLDGNGDSRKLKQGANKQTAPKLPHERDESINPAGTISSEAMKQANRDIKHGLKDTDRGTEVGRTYKKLKQSQ